MNITWRSDFYGWKEDTKKPLFTDKEYIALNDSIQLIKYDPKTIKDNPPLVAENLRDLFAGFTIYQFPKISEYRRSPLRVIYSEKHGKKFELKGINEPIYELMRYLKSAKLLPDDWIKNENMYRYILFFFDNVAGRHGRFDLIDLQDQSVAPVEQLVDRIDNFYRLPSQTENAKAEVRANYEKEFREKLGENFTDEHIEMIKSTLRALFDNTSVEGPTVTEEPSEGVYKNFYMIFKNSLFRADIRFSAHQDGYVSLENEVLCVVNIFKDEKGNIEVRVQPDEGEEADSETTLPHDEKRDNISFDELLF